MVLVLVCMAGNFAYLASIPCRSDLTPIAVVEYPLYDRKLLNHTAATL